MTGDDMRKHIANCIKIAVIDVRWSKIVAGSVDGRIVGGEGVFSCNVIDVLYFCSIVVVLVVEVVHHAWYNISVFGT